MSAADRMAVHDLLVGYFRGFDEERTDAAFLRETFTGRRPPALSSWQRDRHRGDH
jgi:hypothetical protein